MAGHHRDVNGARQLLDDTDPAVRVTALGALARARALDASVLAQCLADAEPTVRRRACQEAGRLLGARASDGDEDAGAVELVDVVRGALDDRAPMVVEMAAWALGEGGRRAAGAVKRLAALCRHPHPLCRESAVAALGAIGDPAGLSAVLAALDDRPPIRRRAVVALVAFDEPAAAAALRRAAADNDWQVRQAAEELLREGDDACAGPAPVMGSSTVSRR